MNAETRALRDLGDAAIDVLFTGFAEMLAVASENLVVIVADVLRDIYVAYKAGEIVLTAKQIANLTAALGIHEDHEGGATT